MSTSAKIRFLLAIVCAAFLLTAIVVKHTFTPRFNLDQTAGVLQTNLNNKEAYINKFLKSADGMKRLKRLDTGNQSQTLAFIQDFTTDNHIWVCTYVNRHLTFWSGVKTLPSDPGQFHEGINFSRLDNGYYHVVKKTDGNFVALFLTPVKTIYYYQNRYLHDAIDKGLLTDDNLDIADVTDRQVYPVKSLNKAYLFSVKLKPGQINHRFYYLEVIFWLLGFLSLCTLIHNTCNYVAGKGRPFLSFAVLGVFIVLLRYINIAYTWPGLGSFELFSPTLYASNIVFPSLGDFCINLLSACWFFAFVYHHRHKIVRKPVGRAAAYAIVVICSAGIMLLATALLILYYGLVINSHINFDVTNVFNLSGYSLLGVLMLCFTFLLFYLLNDTLLIVTRRLPVPAAHKLWIFIGFVLLATLITVILKDASMFYLLVGLFTVLRGRDIWYTDGKLNATSFLSLVAICALISAVKLYHFQDIKDFSMRQSLAQKLETADDAIADSTFHRIEHDILTAKVTTDYFHGRDRNDEYLKNKLQKNYFDGYLSKYEVKVYAFDGNGEPITSDKGYLLGNFKDQVAYTSVKKVSDFFYHDNTFGSQSYFAMLPVSGDDPASSGTLVIQLVAKPLLAGSTFPDLLVNGERKSDEAFKDHSYAFYSDNVLLNQSGKVNYPRQNNVLKGTLRKFVIQKTRVEHVWYKPMAVINHMIYQASERNMIVVSREEDPIAQGVTSLTFFFVTLLSFSGVVVFASWLWTRIRIFNIKNQQIKWGFRINMDKILYRSRIQFSVVFTVVFTLLLIGGITFSSISTQYKDQQNDIIREKINRIGAVFEKGLQQGDFTSTPAGQVKFNDFASTYRADLTLYNKLGIPLLTTQPKIYDHNLLARRMNRRAYIAMNKLQQSIFLNDEKIGDLSYKAAYIPITNSFNVTTAYLQLPYFSNESEYNDRKGALLNAMINIYALVFIAIGLFAIVIARQITAPLTFIQQSLSKTIYGQKNELIVWDRDDEIGALVTEYNKMIAQLENSAQRLAQSERETAWREMAKQVAHEIKNPLTPLKLGLQLLDKAWKDKDPKFDQKFERFSKSFVEQIESLSSIASEFSAFAKMPDTKLEQFNVFDIINQAVIIFKQMDNVTIDMEPGEAFLIRADRDQLLRCFNNLLKNAIEAIPDGRLGVIRISHKFNAGHVLIMVGDNGNGIPENLREKIFAPNFTTKSSGTGLGLAFVKNSIENAGGKIWFETERGKGTTFYLNLPKAV
ncbi:GHKL domain-containing protein [Mucilaginibacter mali]|uniref:histidine kinase n=1 Tax=Mucilaginibacter mali TaxID=2740462 RepID=A0A7D4QNK2_9SPHI|nr:ATP-binding protein [Mucilaginibacter mali]QKJ32550.1 GHKL domain-containing protein [Mucilaginibacter mali]